MRNCLLIQNRIHLEAMDIKSGKIMQPNFFKDLNYLKKINPSTNLCVVYGGDQFQKRSESSIYGFNQLDKLNF